MANTLFATKRYFNDRVVNCYTSFILNQKRLINLYLAPPTSFRLSVQKMCTEDADSVIENKTCFKYSVYFDRSLIEFKDL